MINAYCTNTLIDKPIKFRVLIPYAKYFLFVTACSLTEPRTETMLAKLGTPSSLSRPQRVNTQPVDKNNE